MTKMKKEQDDHDPNHVLMFIIYIVNQNDVFERSSKEKWIVWNSNHRPLPRLKHLHSAPMQHKWSPIQHSIDHHSPCLSCCGVLELRGHASLKDLPSFIKIKTLTPLERLIYWFFQIHTGVIFFLLHTWTSSFSLRSPDRKVMYWTVEYLRKLVYRFIGSFHVPQHASNHSNYQVRPFLLLPFLDFKPSTVWHLNDCELQG